MNQVDSSSQPLIPISWLPRLMPLKAVAVAARGLAAHELAKRAIFRIQNKFEALRGVTVNKDLILIMGDYEHLPWADGAIYLGQEPGVNILIPTAIEASIPTSILMKALEAQFPNLEAPYAVLPDFSTVVPLTNIALIQAELLKRWLEK